MAGVASMGAYIPIYRLDVKGSPEWAQRCFIRSPHDIQIGIYQYVIYIGTKNGG